MNKLLVRARCGDGSIIRLMKRWKSRKALVKKLILLNELWIHGYYTRDTPLRWAASSEIARMKQTDIPLNDYIVQRLVSKLANQRRERVLAGIK